MGPIESLEGVEEDGANQVSIQAQMADIQGGEDGENKSSPKVLDVETYEPCRMSESEGGKGFFWLE